MATAPTTPEPFEVKIVNEDLTEAANNHLRQFFYKDEPLNSCAKLISDGNASCKELERYTLKDIKDNVSLAAFTSQGEIMAICMNAIRIRGQAPKEEENCADKKFSKIKKLLMTVDNAADVFGKFPDVDRILDIGIVSVDSKWRGMGLATQLLQKSQKLAKERGCQLISVLCTSEFTARAVAKLGFQLVYAIDYKDYTENEIPVFTPASPHTRATVYVKRIS